MKVYIDTSSLLKLYHRESGTDEVKKYLADNEIEVIYLSDLTKVEFSSAIWKKIRTQEIEEDTGKEFIELFTADTGKYAWIKLSDKIIELAKDAISRHGSKGLRSLDALQLACAMAVSTQPDTVYITSDNLLKTIFNDEELKIV